MSPSIEMRLPPDVSLFLQALKMGNRQDLGDIEVKRGINFIEDHRARAYTHTNTQIYIIKDDIKVNFYSFV